MRASLRPTDDPGAVAGKHTPAVPASAYRRRAIADYLKSLDGTDGLMVKCDPDADTAYIEQDDYEEVPQITIPGRQFPVHTHDVALSVGTRLIQYALALHEHGHDRYTPGPLLKELFDRESFSLPLGDFYWGLVNALEDARIEAGLIAEEGRWAAERLMFLHRNFVTSSPDEMRNPHAMTWQTALDVAAIHYGKGRENGDIIPALEDADDHTLQWRSERDKQLYQWVRPGLKAALDDVTGEADGEAAVNRILKFIRELDTTLSALSDDPPDDDKQQRESASNSTNDRHNDMGSEKEQPSALDDSDGEGGDGSKPETAPSEDTNDSDSESDNRDEFSAEYEGDESADSGDESADNSQEEGNGTTDSEVTPAGEETDASAGGDNESDNQQSTEGEPDSRDNEHTQSDSRPQSEEAQDAPSDNDEANAPSGGDASDSDRESGDVAGSSSGEESESGDERSIGNGGGNASEPNGDGENAPQTTETRSERDNDEESGQLSGNSKSESGTSEGQADRGSAKSGTTDDDTNPSADKSSDNQNETGVAGGEDSADTLSKRLLAREKRKSTHEERQVERDKEALTEELKRLQTAIGAGGGDISQLAIADDTKHNGSSEVWGRIESEADMLKGPLQSALQQTEQTEFQRGTRTGRFDPKMSHRLAVNNLAVNQVSINGDEKRYSVIVVLDRSGSMSSNIDEAEVAAAGFAMALEELDIDVAIVDLYQNDARMVKPFPAQTRNKRDILTSGVVGGGTPLTDALVVSRERVRQEPHFPFMFVVSDGKPFEHDRYLNELEETNFPVLGVTIGEETASDLDQYYDVARSVTAENIGDELVNLATEIMF